MSEKEMKSEIESRRSDIGNEIPLFERIGAELYLLW
jgi:hypothetical protein